MNIKSTSSKPLPTKSIVLTFLICIIMGAVLLWMPFSRRNDVSFFDALFTSTSAVCVTGLIVKDTPVDFSFWGQLIILLLIQIGGLGYMTLASFGWMLIGRKMTVSRSIMMKEFLNLLSIQNLSSFIFRMILWVVSMEILGTIILYFKFQYKYHPTQALFYAFFHGTISLQ